jgi:hypothetical protein
MVEDRGRAEVRAASGARFGVVLAAVVLLAGLTAIILTSSPSEQGAAAPAPLRCLEAWNSDSQAVAFGRHNSVSHGYSDVQVGHMLQEGSASLSSEPDGGECAVVFAADQLDPELLAAGQIQLKGQWVPFSSLLEPADLAALQSAAVGGANATVTPKGNLIEQAP